MNRKKDFVLETEGNCFICFKNKNNSSFTSFSTYSLQRLCHFLKIDMKKTFFINQEHNYNYRDILKVELCKTCASIIKEFTNLHSQLEIIELNISDCLTKLNDKVTITTNISETEKFKMVENLRNEIKVKCFAKIQKSLPKIYIPKLNHWEMELLTSKRNFVDVTINCQNSTEIFYDESGNDNYNDNDIDIDIKWESPEFEEVKITPESEEHLNSEWTVPNPNFDSEMNDFNFEPTNFKKSEVFLETEPDPGNNTNTKSKLPRAKKVKKRNKKCQRPPKDNGAPAPIPPTTTTDYSFAIVALKETSQAIKDKRNDFSRIPGTTKYKCSLCPKEYNYKDKVEVHFDCVHLHLRYKCLLCEMTFTNESNYRSHHRTVHLRIKVCCSVCGLKFKDRNCLRKHCQTSHCASEMTGTQRMGHCVTQCDTCGIQFKYPMKLLKHNREVHNIKRSYDCVICGRSFGLKRLLQEHQITCQLD